MNYSSEHQAFTEGPTIKIIVYLDDEGVDRIHLKHGIGFSCEIFSNLKDPSIRDDILHWLTAFSRRQKLPPLPLLKGKKLTAFQNKVLSAMRTIPFGSTESYGGLAEKAGYPHGGRAVGNVCRSNPFPLLIPCHRIIHKNGGIGGFAYDISLKKKLLSFEGISI